MPDEAVPALCGTLTWTRSTEDDHGLQAALCGEWTTAGP